MANIQVSAERKQEIQEAHRLWLSELPRQAGQLGGTIGALVEGPPVYTPGEVTTYSDFAAVRYLVDPAFVDFLKVRNIPFREN